MEKIEGVLTFIWCNFIPVRFSLADSLGCFYKRCLHTVKGNIFIIVALRLVPGACAVLEGSSSACQACCPCVRPAEGPVCLGASCLFSVPLQPVCSANLMKGIISPSASCLMPFWATFQIPGNCTRNALGLSGLSFSPVKVLPRYKTIPFPKDRSQPSQEDVCREHLPWVSADKSWAPFFCPWWVYRAFPTYSQTY